MCSLVLFYKHNKNDRKNLLSELMIYKSSCDNNCVFTTQGMWLRTGISWAQRLKSVFLLCNFIVSPPPQSWAVLGGPAHWDYSRLLLAFLFHYSGVWKTIWKLWKSSTVHTVHVKPFFICSYKDVLKSRYIINITGWFQVFQITNVIIRSIQQQHIKQPS